MGEVVINVLKWTFRIGFIIAGLTSFIILLNVAFGFIFVTLDASILGDLMALVQMWLPFNLSAITGWLIAATAAYVTYRLTVVAYNYIARLTA